MPLNHCIFRFTPFITQSRKIDTADKIPICRSICISSFFTSQYYTLSCHQTLQSHERIIFYCIGKINMQEQLYWDTQNKHTDKYPNTKNIR